jgi:arginase
MTYTDFGGRDGGALRRGRAAHRVVPAGELPALRGAGPDEVGAGLTEFAGGEKFGGLVITEVNPDHDPDGELLRTLAQVVTGALAGSAA